MRTNTQEALLSAYIVSIGKRTPRDAASEPEGRIASLTRISNGTFSQCIP